jgi:acetyl-CoA C-acetyltransferase
VTLDPRTPVLVGVGQITDRPAPGARFADRPTPLSLMVDALAKAGADARGRVLAHLDELVAIRSFVWHPSDPARLVADALGITPRRTRLTPTGGNTPQQLVHEYSRRILAGELEAVAVVGSEAMHARSLARREGVPTGWVEPKDGGVLDHPLDEERPPLTADEFGAGLTTPTDVYPLFENARRARRGDSAEQQRQRLGDLWASFARVAATNPYAWITDGPSADAIATPAPNNRLIAAPYTKLLVANMPVDMGAAYILTSLAFAENAGVPRDAMVFPHTGADASDHWFVSERPELDDSPAMRAIWAALESSGVRADDLAHLDFYSCFPTVVQTAGEITGIDVFDPARPATVTGGLTFGGGPGNNYVTHSIASMVDRLRATPGSQGLVTGLGWFSTKHAWGTYSTEPPASAFAYTDVQPDVDAGPKVTVRADNGDASVETFTVVYDRDGAPSRVVVAARWSDGARVWAKADHGDVLSRFVSDAPFGDTITVRDGVVL